MPKVIYKPKEFKGDRLNVVTRAAQYVTDYARQGYDLTLRQLYYQFIGDDAFPESWRDPVSGSKNVEKNYKNLGKLVSDARLAGLIDWDRIKDRGRSLNGAKGGDESVAQVIDGATFFPDMWEGQPTMVEVWVEKEALVDVIGRAAWRSGLVTPYFACKGYTSQTAMWEASQRLRGYVEDGMRVKVIHLGDHDPSGIDMTRDIEDRLCDFMEQDLLNGSRTITGSASVCDIWLAAADEHGVDPWDTSDEDLGLSVTGRRSQGVFDVERIALNWDQVQEYDPPPSPTKLTDSRATGYIVDHGYECWELDALEPSLMDSLIQARIRANIDHEIRDAQIDRQRIGQRQLNTLASNWDAVAEFLETL